MDKFVLITGAFGFLGYHTALKFKREGYQVIGFGLGEITQGKNKLFINAISIILILLLY